MPDIQTLVNAIPDANDGNIISSDYHNTIKAALEAIAAQMGGAAGGQTVTLSLLPTFSPVQPVAVHVPWNMNVGVASDAGGNLTDGWLPLYLPQGAVIQSLAVVGVKTLATTPTTFSANVELDIMSIGVTGGTTLISVDLTNALGNPFRTTPQTPAVAGTTPQSLKDLQTVKNDQNKYIVRAIVNPSPAAGTLTIHAMQVVYTTPQ